MADLVPEGYYKAVGIPTIDENSEERIARLAWTKNDVRQVVAYFELLEGDGEGRRLPWYGFFTKDAGKRTVESLRFMGFKGDDLDGVEEQPLDQVVSVKVGHNTYNGKTTARVDFVNRAGGGAIKLNKPMSANDKRTFSAMMRDSVSTIPEVEGERRVKESATRGNDSRADDGGDHEFGVDLDDGDPGFGSNDVPF